MNRAAAGAPRLRPAADTAGVDRDLWTAAWAMPAALRALVPEPAPTPARALEVLLRTAARRLAGMRVTVPGTGMRLQLDALEVRPDPLGLPLGQLDDVRIAARDVEWRDLRCRRLEAVWRNVHLRPSSAPVVLSAPVEVEVALSVTDVTALMAHRRPGLVLDVVHAAGTAEAVLRWSAHPWWAAVAVTADVAARALFLRPVGLRIGARRIPLPGWLPSVRVEMPQLPRGLRLRDLAVGDEEITFRLVADEWRQALTPSWLAAAASWLDRFA